MKRLVEIFFCSLILLLLSPILLLIVVLIKYDTKGTIFFFSTRVGINNSIYNMPKFRTMYAETEIVETSKLKDAVKPGITGYAQVNGRNMISLDKKISLEYEYVKKKSFFVDFLIIIKTLKVIFKHNEISH